MAELDEIEIQHLKIHWEHFKLHFDLLQKYLDIAIKFLTFFILLSAGIISYYLVHPEIKNLRFALLFPVFIGSISIFFFIYGINRTKPTIESINKIASGLLLTNIPEYTILTKLLWFCTVIFFVTISILSILFLWGIT